MGTKVQLRPLSGTHSEAPLCYLLVVDKFNILLDCGWTDAFDVNDLQELAKAAPSVDAVLLSHPDTLHLGALPYAVGKLGLTAPAYCTMPVHRLGLMYMYDHFYSRRAVSNFDVFTMEDVDMAFDNTVQLKYSQDYPLSDKGEGITITPYAAGRLLGGTVWKISKDTEDIIYAVDYNHRKERHLNGTVLETMTRPAVLITDAYNALVNQSARQKRDQDFIDLVMRHLRANGNVLLPVDTAGRVLEMILFMEQNWAHNRLPYPVAFISNVADSTIESAKSLLEWMSDAIAKSFERTRDNPFLFKYLKLCHNRKELDELPPGPKVVFATMASLEAGFARELFTEWAGDERNLVLFTEKGQVGTFARRCLQVEPPPPFVIVTMSRKIPLTGDELRAYEEEQARVKREQERKEKELREKELREKEQKEKEFKALKQAEENGDSAAQETQVVMASDAADAVAQAPSTDAGAGTVAVVRQFGDVLIDGFVPPPEAVAPMFPFYENTSEWDEFGEVINPDDYMSKEEEAVDFMSTVPALVGDAAVEEKIEGDVVDLLLHDKPSKVVTNDLVVIVKCSLQYIDFEGRSDGRSIKTILQHVAPLKLVLIHGPAESTEHLKQHCLKNVTPFVFSPRVGETVDVTSDLSAYKVTLTEQLMSNVIFRKLGGYELAWVDGAVGKQDEDETFPLLPVESPPPHKAVLVEDLRLADFRHLLATKGVQAEFSGGMLRCGNHISVRKVIGGHQVVIEGPLCEDYYKIRDLLYSQFHMF